MTERDRRAGEPIVLPVYLSDDRQSVETADGEVVGLGFKPFLDGARTIEIVEDDRSPVLPGVFYTRVAGVSFHDDVLQLPQFGAGREIEIRHEPANARDRTALAVFGGDHRVGYVPDPVAGALAPPGTRRGRGVILMEWSTNGVRNGISVLGSMHVNLALASGDEPDGHGGP
jgi:hypothetical protein